MQELLDKLQSLHNLNPEQSKAILNTIKNYIVEKFPMVEGMVGNLFGSDGDAGASSSSASMGSATDAISDRFGK